MTLTKVISQLRKHTPIAHNDRRASALLTLPSRYPAIAGLFPRNT